MGSHAEVKLAFLAHGFLVPLSRSGLSLFLVQAPHAAFRLFTPRGSLFHFVITRLQRPACWFVFA